MPKPKSNSAKTQPAQQEKKEKNQTAKEIGILNKTSESIGALKKVTRKRNVNQQQ